MKKISFFILCLTFLFDLCGCSSQTLKGKTFTREDLSVYYTDRTGNVLTFDKDNYDYFEIEKQKKEGYIITNYTEHKYTYSFISKNVVKYEYKGTSNISYNCEYSIEDNDLIKIKCNDDIELLKYNKENNCIIDENDKEYCIE